MVCNQRRCHHVSYIPSILSPFHVLSVTINVGITLYKKTHNSLSWIILRLDATAKTSAPHLVSTGKRNLLLSQYRHFHLFFFSRHPYIQSRLSFFHRTPG